MGASAINCCDPYCKSLIPNSLTSTPRQNTTIHPKPLQSNQLQSTTQQLMAEAPGHDEYGMSWNAGPLETS
jgi:hypothetical protein